jgi:hypothetical protein
VPDQGEAVRQILDVIHVRDSDCHFVTLVDLELFSRLNAGAIECM